MTSRSSKSQRHTRPLRILFFALLAVLNLSGSATAQRVTSAVSLAPSTTLVPLPLPSLVSNATSQPATAPSDAAFSGSTTSAPSNSSLPGPPSLDTRVDPAFGVLGGLLLITGGATSGWGARNRWTSFFCVGFYAGALVVGMLILHFGVAGAVIPPTDKTRGLFLFASLAGGAVIGALSIVFWKGVQFICSAFGGFCFSLFLLCLRSDSLIRPVGYRYILIAGLTTLCFVLSTFKGLTAMMTLLSTAAIGSTAVVLGVDCFTTSNLKEFYIFNIGFNDSLWPKLSGHFKLTTAIQIELGVLGAIFVASVAWQFRGYDLLVKGKKELEAADRARRIAEEDAGFRSRRDTATNLELWEEKNGSRSPSSTSTLLGPSPGLLRKDTDSIIETPRATRSSLHSELLPQLDFSAPLSDDPAAQPTLRIETRKSLDWDAYLASRRLSTASHDPASPAPPPSAARTNTGLSFPRLSVLPPIHSDSGHSEEDVPLATLTSPPISSPALFFAQPRPSAVTRNSLPTRPASLAFPSPTTEEVKDTRRRTMIDLNAAPDILKRPGPVRTSTADQRILVGEQRPVVRVPPPPAAKIMDVEELQTKHRRRLSELQMPITSAAQTEAEAIAIREAYEKRRQREASEMRRVEQQRAQDLAAGQSGSERKRLNSVGSLLDKARSPTGSATPPLANGDHPRRRSLNTVLDLKGGTAPAEGGKEQRRESRRISGIDKVAHWQAGASPKVETPSPVEDAAKKGKYGWMGY